MQQPRSCGTAWKESLPDTEYAEVRDREDVLQENEYTTKRRHDKHVNDDEAGHKNLAST